ncbi:erythromycin esterase-domain-containing protein [Rostrohypoxylon terebratum]|nr:erythromycin esterase-domain-containing protein [Rostrohypoxylon terebratum]
MADPNSSLKILVEGAGSGMVSSFAGDARLRKTLIALGPFDSHGTSEFYRARAPGDNETSDPRRARAYSLGTHVAAALEWDEPMQVMNVIPSRPDSYECAMHDTGMPPFVVDLRLLRIPPVLQRFIGVVYHPATERPSHYIKSVFADQYDAFVWFDRTSAVHTLEIIVEKGSFEGRNISI